MDEHGEHWRCFRSLQTGNLFHLSGPNGELEMGLWHGTDLILVMSGQGNLPRVAREEGNITPVVCLGETDTDGLETLRCFCTIPQVQHQCLHTSLAFYPPTGPPELSRDKLCNFLAAEPDAVFLPGKVPCVTSLGKIPCMSKRILDCSKSVVSFHRHVSRTQK